MKLRQMPGYTLSETNPEIRKVIKEALTSTANRYLTICEQLRFMYDTVLQLPDGEIKNDLTEKIIDAFSMGKKMNSRLAHYKRKYQDESGHGGKSLIRLYSTKARIRLRQARSKT